VAKLTDLPDDLREPEDVAARTEKLVKQEREEAVQRWLDAIEAMRGEGCWDWADETLSGIYDTVYQGRFVSDRQKRAIRNIRDRHAEKAEELGIEEL